MACFNADNKITGLVAKLNGTVYVYNLKNISFTWIVIIEIFAYHSHFFTATLDFTSFSQWNSWGTYIFFTAGLFLD